MSNGIEANTHVPERKELLRGHDPKVPPPGWLTSEGVKAFAAALTYKSCFKIDPLLLYNVLVTGISFISMRFDHAIKHIYTGPHGQEDELLRQLSYFLRPGPNLVQVKLPPPAPPPPVQADVPRSTPARIEPSWEASWQIGGVDFAIDTRRQDGRPLIQYRVGGLVVGEVSYFSTRASDYDYFDDRFRQAAATGELDEWFQDLVSKLGQTH